MQWSWQPKYYRGHLISTLEEYNELILQRKKSELSSGRLPRYFKLIMDNVDWRLPHFINFLQISSSVTEAEIICLRIKQVNHCNANSLPAKIHEKVN